jgi:biopolymer transport protein ExbB
MNLNFLQSGLELLHRGGWVMWPLLLLSTIAVAVMLERAFALREVAVDNDKLMDDLRILIMEEREAEALQRAEATPGPVAAIIASGLRNRHLDFPDIERAMEELALRETPLLHERLGVLDTVITLAPLLGLLGTITGMIQAFDVVSSASGAEAPAAITGGVAEALIATATGLSVAIMTLPFYNYFTERVKEMIANMEIRATQLLNILALRRHSEEQRKLISWQSKKVTMPELFNVHTS